MKTICTLALIIGGAAFGTADPPQNLHATKNETVTIAGKYRSAFYTDPVREENWLWPYRALTLTDAFQTASDPNHDCSRVYHGMSSDEAFAVDLAFGYLIERLVTGIRDYKTREVVGWIVTAIRFDAVAGNMRLGTAWKF